MQISPAFFRSAQLGLQADVYHLSVDVARQIAPGLSLAAVVNTYVQRGRFSAPLANTTIPHQEVMIRLVVEPARSHALAPRGVALPPPVAASCPANTYVIGPEDVLDIAVWDNPQITRTVPVRPDGQISLPLLNDVQAAGLTPMQLRRLTCAGRVHSVGRLGARARVTASGGVIGQVRHRPLRTETRHRARRAIVAGDLWLPRVPSSFFREIGRDGRIRSRSKLTAKVGDERVEDGRPAEPLPPPWRCRPRALGRGDRDEPSK